MRFSLAESMCLPAEHLPLAVAAEEAGYTSFTVPDTMCYPRASDNRYPYTDTGDRGVLEDVPFIEPFCMIAAMGAVTTPFRFTTCVLRLLIRQPVLVASEQRRAQRCR